MKRFSVLSFLFVSCLFVTSLFGKEQKVEEPLPTIITGTVIGKEFDEIVLNVFDKISPNDQYNTYKERIDFDGNFRFVIHSYDVARSYISLGETNNVCEIYLLSGDDLDLQIEYEFGEEKPVITFNGKWNSIQKFFIELDEKFPFDNEYFEHFYYSKNYKKSKRYWNNWRDKQLDFHDQYFRGSALPQVAVDEALNKIQYEWAFSRTYYILFHHFWAIDAEPIKLDGHDYDYLKEIKFNNPDAKYSYKYRKFLNLYGNLLYWRAEKQLDSLPDFEQRNNGFYDLAVEDAEGVARDIIIAGRLNEAMRGVTSRESLSEIKKILDKFKILSDSNDYYQNTMEVYNKRLDLMPGIPAYNFTLNDLEGNLVKLSDFKGKIVYIDFWSIGCSPCMKEIPYANKLLKNLEDVSDDIVFLSINTNYGQADRVRNFVAKRNIPGVHLISSLKTNKKLKKEFMLSGNPHYLLIDRDGSMLNANMTRPSMNKTEIEIRAALGK
ncbi:MAG: TlpA family protein disulfide reductase [Chlorobi bacterium]|nr:TlpA family protein disulfide reductase [Chlorobiota bacterium]